MRKDEIRKPFLEITEIALLPKGYRKQKCSEGFEYLYRFEEGFYKVFPTIWQYDKLFFISYGFSLRINKVSEVLALINNISEEYKNDYVTLGFGVDSLIKINDNRIKVESLNELNEALRLLKSVLENEAMIFFDKIKTVSDLDFEINHENRPKDLYCSDVSQRPFVGLITAVLNRNPQSRYWENYYRDRIKNSNQYIKNQYEKLVEYLKNNFPGSLTE